jgi:hypothetical protein
MILSNNYHYIEQIECHTYCYIAIILINMNTVVKELRSKMFGQHPGYFKAVYPASKSLQSTEISLYLAFTTVVYPIRNGHFKMADCTSSKR